MMKKKCTILLLCVKLTEERMIYMFEKILKKSGWSDLLIALLFVLFGIMLIVSPEVVTAMISIILGGICIIIGILKLFDYISRGKTEKYLLAISIAVIITGIIIMFCGNVIFSIFRILIAIWIIYSGIMNLQTSIIWKDYKSRLWLVTLIMSIVMICAGIYILVNQGAMIQILGGIIIAYGIFDIIENIIFIKKVDNYLRFLYNIYEGSSLTSCFPCF